MTVDTITTQLKQIATHELPLGASFKFVFENGIVHIDSTGEKAVISNDDKEADCSIHLKTTTYEEIKAGKMSKNMAMLMGKVRVKGDLELVTRIQNFI